MAGEPAHGGPEVLSELHGSILNGLPEFDRGFGVFPFLGEEIFRQIRDGMERRVKDALESVTGRAAPAFRLQDYHRFCHDNEEHLAVVGYLRERSDLDFFPIAHVIVDDRISALCKARMSCRVARFEASGRFFLRIIRPRHIAPADNNPLHRDSWLDRLKDGVNAYIPLAGSNSRSSLPVLPGSHRWPESDVVRTRHGAVVEGARFTVPGVLEARHALRLERPAVQDNELMLFSPHLIHGGAVNLNQDVTRVSLEMRFWRV